MDFTEIQRIVRTYYEQICANKLDKLCEMDKFLGNTVFQTYIRENQKPEQTN